MLFSDKHLFFDLDRTLWDFDQNSATAIRHILKNEEIEFLVKGFDTFYPIYVKKMRNYGGNMEREKSRKKNCATNDLRFPLSIFLSQKLIW